MGQDTAQETRWRNACRNLLKISARDYAGEYQQYQTVREIFYQELSTAFARSLRRRLDHLSQETFENKTAVASYVNDQLRGLGLAMAILCPRTDRPARLVVDRENDPSGYMNSKIS